MNEFKLDLAVGYVVNRAAHRLKVALHRAFKANGLDITPEHWAVLNCLWEKDGISQTEIAERVMKDKTNLTRILDIMEKKGWIVRHDHESDRRSNRIVLTEKARASKDRIIAVGNGRKRTGRPGVECR